MEYGRSVLTDVVERADIRVRDAGDRARFLPEAVDTPARRVDELAGQELDGNDPIEPRIVRPIYLAHPTRAERREDLVGAQA